MKISVRIHRNGSVGGVTEHTRSKTCFVASKHAFCRHQSAMEVYVRVRRPCLPIGNSTPVYMRRLTARGWPIASGRSSR